MEEQSSEMMCLRSHSWQTLKPGQTPQPDLTACEPPTLSLHLPTYGRGLAVSWLSISDWACGQGKLGINPFMFLTMITMCNWLLQVLMAGAARGNRSSEVDGIKKAHAVFLSNWEAIQ